jgi:hypothetical protein
VDRKGAAVLGALAAAALLGADGPDLSVIHAARWLAPGADKVRALGSIATECLSRPADAESAYWIEVGRAAFKSPLLLGGQAARAGLACDSCHQDGRNNPDFFFPGVSGAPGTATRAALLSSHPADGIDHPKPIPNLSGPKSSLKVNQDVQVAALEPFVHGLVTEEFDGAEPPAAVIRGLAAYVRALSPEACPAQAREPLTAAVYIDNARRAARASLGALDRGDPQTAAFLAQAARSPLGLIYERYDQPGADPARAVLHAADLGLAAAAEAIRDHDPRARDRLVAWLAESERWAKVVERAEPGSLFNPRRLALERQP